MKQVLLAITCIGIGISIIGCDRQRSGEKPQAIYGEWGCVYQLLGDGTKNYDKPYVLLGFEYSDGFILKEDGTGQAIWYEKANGDFAWEKVDDQLIFKVSRTNDDMENFEFKVSDLTDTSMFLESPGGKRYFMEKITPK